MRAVIAAPAVMALVLLGCGGANQLDRRQARGEVDLGRNVREVPARGHLVEVSRAERRDARGELLAVDPGYVWVQTEGGVVPIERAEIHKIGVELREDDAGLLGLWTTLGTASTLSHGFWLVISAPVWLSAGIAVSVNEANDGTETAFGHSIDLLYQFARYPQGPPADLLQSTLGISAPARRPAAPIAPTGPATGPEGLGTPRPHVPQGYGGEPTPERTFEVEPQQD